MSSLGRCSCRSAERRTYYDGPPRRGLDLGVLGGRGDVTRVASWIEGERFADEVQTERDTHGNALSNVDGRGSRREYVWDPEDHTFPLLERVVGNPQILEFRAEYDRGTGSVLSLSDPNGHTTRVAYDALGRSEALVAPGDTAALPTLAWRYESGAPVSLVREERRERSGAGNVLVRIRYWDGLGNERGDLRQAGAGRWAASGLQSRGARGFVRLHARPSFERSADIPVIGDGRSGVRKSYDALGRAVREVEPDDSERRMTYSALTVNTFDENDSDEVSEHFDTPVRHETDGLNRVRRVSERDGDREVVTTFDYDPLGNLIWMRDAGGRERAYVFDGRSRRTIVDDPNAGVWRFEYDDADGLARRVDPAGNGVRWERDAMGRVETVWHEPHGGTERAEARFHYDVASEQHPQLGNAIGQLAWVEDAAGRVFFGYDDHARIRDRVRQFTDGSEYTTWTDFDAAGRAVRRGFPDGTHLAA